MSLPLSSDRTITLTGEDPSSTARRYANLLYLLGEYISAKEDQFDVNAYPAPQIQNTSRPITSLPTELQIKILICLPWQTQALCMLVCKDWREILTTQEAIESRYTVYYEPRMHYMWNQQARMVKFTVCEGRLTELFFEMDRRELPNFSSEPHTEESVWMRNFANHPMMEDPLFFYDLKGRFPVIGKRINDWGELQQADHTQRIIRIDLYTKSRHAKSGEVIIEHYISCNVNTTRSIWREPGTHIKKPRPRWDFGSSLDLTHRRLFESVAEIVGSIRKKRKSVEIHMTKMDIRENRINLMSMLEGEGNYGLHNRTNEAVLSFVVEYVASGHERREFERMEKKREELRKNPPQKLGPQIVSINGEPYVY